MARSYDYSSEVTRHLRSAILGRLKRGEKIFPTIQGREKVKADLLRALLSGSHPYLISEEGTGKTLIAKAVAQLLPPIRAVRGCPFRDDPDGRQGELCPGCSDAASSGRLEVEMVPGPKRLSRVQGNEFTNEAKLLGVKDIRKLAEGASAGDPRIFLGTGVFQAHRGILFLDELPAIRTKVQVLLHPILDEGRITLEEFAWERRIDLVMIATGNPQNFAHVNEVPRPLLDRLEMIWVDLPDERDEAEIMVIESFGAKRPVSSPDLGQAPSPLHDEHKAGPRPESDERAIDEDYERPAAITPWWVKEIIVKTVRNSRDCPRLEWGSSIRGSIKAGDHTISSAELKGRRVAMLDDAFAGLKLALRGRVKLASEYMEPADGKGELGLADTITEDCGRMALETMGREMVEHLKGEGLYMEALSREVLPALGLKGEEFRRLAFESQSIKKFLRWMEGEESRRYNSSASDLLIHRGAKEGHQLSENEEWVSAAIEFLLTSAASLGLIEEKALSSHLTLPHLFSGG